MPEAQPQHPHPGPQPPPALLGLGVRGREVPAHESSVIAGERGRDNLGISHPSLPRKGGSGRERPGGARGWERKPAA